MTVLLFATGGLLVLASAFALHTVWQLDRLTPHQPARADAGPPAAATRFSEERRAA